MLWGRVRITSKPGEPFVLRLTGMWVDHQVSGGPLGSIQLKYIEFDTNDKSFHSKNDSERNQLTRNR